MRIERVVVSTQHVDGKSQDEIRQLRHREARSAVRSATCCRRPTQVPHQSDGQLRRRRAARRLPASPAARSSSTPTAAAAGTAAARSAARTRPRSIAAPPTSAATSPRTSCRPASPSGAKCSSRTPSAWPSRRLCSSRPSGRRQRQGRRVRPHDVRHAPARHHPHARPAAPDLPPDDQLRPLRTSRSALGEVGKNGRTEERKNGEREEGMNRFFRSLPSSDIVWTCRCAPLPPSSGFFSSPRLGLHGQASRAFVVAHRGASFYAPDTPCRRIVSRSSRAPSTSNRTW